MYQLSDLDILDNEARRVNQQTGNQIETILRDMLKDLTTKSPILGVAIFSIEGLPLVSHFYGGTEEVTIAAMVASMYSAAEQSVRELRQGSLKSVIVEGEFGTTIVIAIPDGYLLCVTAPENAKLGLVFNDAKKAAHETGRVIREML